MACPVWLHHQPGIVTTMLRLRINNYADGRQLSYSGTPILRSRHYYRGSRAVPASNWRSWRRFWVRGIAGLELQVLQSLLTQPLAKVLERPRPQVLRRTTDGIGCSHIDDALGQAIARRHQPLAKRAGLLAQASIEPDYIVTVWRPPASCLCTINGCRSGRKRGSPRAC